MIDFSDIFHRYFIHNQLEPNLVQLERYLISDIEVDGIEGNTFIYINGLDDTIINKIKSLLEEENFILVFNHDHEAFGVILLKMFIILSMIIIYLLIKYLLFTLISIIKKH